MKTRFVPAFCVTSLCLSCAATAQYQPGFSWDRSNEWMPGPSAGANIGNPSPDTTGSSVWSYEWVQGGALGSANEWFAQPTTMSVWDPDWFGINSGGAWVQADNMNPPIFSNRMTHNVHEASAASMPLVRWMNPAGNGALVDIVGDLNVIWSGDGYVGEPVAVDVVIAMADASTGLTTPLLATTVNKPLATPSILDSETINVGLSGLTLDDGDSLVFSLRGQSQFQGSGRWVILEDDVQISLTPIPAPGAAILLGASGLVAMRRRR